MYSFKQYVISFFALFLAACGGSDDGPSPTTVPNLAPTPASDTLSMVLGQSILLDVLANDTDPEGDSLTISALSDVTGGDAVIEGDQVRFTTGDVAGSFTFTYTVTDGNGNSASTNVDIVIDPVSIQLSGLVPFAYASETVYAEWGSESISATITDQATYSLSLSLSDLTSFISVSADNSANGPGYLKSHIGVVAESIRSGSSQFTAADIVGLSLNEARTALAFFVERANGAIPTNNAEYAQLLRDIPLNKLVKLTDFLLLASNDDPALPQGFGPVSEWLADLDTDLLLADANALPFDELGISDAIRLDYWNDLMGDSVWEDASSALASGKTTFIINDNVGYAGYSLALGASNTFEYVDDEVIEGEYTLEDGVLNLTGANGEPFSSFTDTGFDCDSPSARTNNVLTRNLILLATSQEQDIFLSVDEIERVQRDGDNNVCNTTTSIDLSNSFVPKEDGLLFDDLIPTGGLALTLLIPDNDDTYTLGAHVQFGESSFTIKNTDLGGNWSVDGEELTLDFTDGFTYMIEKVREQEAYDIYFAELMMDTDVIGALGGFAVDVDNTLANVDFEGRFEWQFFDSDYSVLGFTFQEDGRGFQSFNMDVPAEWAASRTAQYTWESSNNEVSMTYTIDRNAGLGGEPVFGDCPPEGDCVIWRTRSWEVIGEDGNLVYLINNQTIDTGLRSGGDSDPLTSGYVGIYRREALVLPPLD